MSTRIVDSISDRELIITREFNAPRELVWEAWTSAEHIPNWMLGPEGWSMPKCELDLRVGGAWHFVWRNANGKEMEMHGRYIEIKPPESVSTTESWGGDWPETINNFIFTEQSGKTTITLIVHYPSKQARDTAMQTGMTKGLEMSFQRLEALLCTLAGRKQ